LADKENHLAKTSLRREFNSCRGATVEISPARRAGLVVHKMKRPDGTMASGVHSGRMDFLATD